VARNSIISNPAQPPCRRGLQPNPSLILHVRSKEAVLIQTLPRRERLAGAQIFYFRGPSVSGSVCGYAQRVLLPAQRDQGQAASLTRVIDQCHPAVFWTLEPDLVPDIHCYSIKVERIILIGAGLEGILQQEFAVLDLRTGFMGGRLRY
jgi:hypothetical protein